MPVTADMDSLCDYGSVCLITPPSMGYISFLVKILLWLKTFLY